MPASGFMHEGLYRVRNRRSNVLGKARGYDGSWPITEVGGDDLGIEGLNPQPTSALQVLRRSTTTCQC